MSARRVLVAHPEVLAAEGIAAALARYPALMPVGIATTVEELRSAPQADAVALDARLDDAGAAAAQLRRLGVRVVVIDGQGPEGHSDDEGIRVPRHAPIAALASALAPGVDVDGSRLRGLTARERQVLALVAKGLPGKQVARLLGISVKTVEHHKTRIFGKLGVQSQAAAVAVMAQGSALWTLSTT